MKGETKVRMLRIDDKQFTDLVQERVEAGGTLI